MPHLKLFNDEVMLIEPYPSTDLFPDRYAILVKHAILGLVWLEVKPFAIAPMIFHDWNM